MASKKKSSKAGSSKKQTTDKDKFKRIAKIGIGMGAVGLGGMAVGAKMTYDQFHKIPKKYLSEEEYKEYDSILSGLSKMTKAKMYALGEFECDVLDEKCRRALLLNEKAMHAHYSALNFKWYNPITWFA